MESTDEMARVSPTLRRSVERGLNLPQPAPMDRGNGVVAGESLPAMVPTKAQVSLTESAVVEAEAKARVAVAEALEAEAKAKAAVAKAEAKAKSAVAKAEAKAKAAVAKVDAEARVADAEAAAKARVAEAEATTKVRVAAAEALEADLKILKLRKEIDVFTGESEVKEYLCVSVSPSVSLSVCHFLFF